VCIPANSESFGHFVYEPTSCYTGVNFISCPKGRKEIEDVREQIADENKRMEKVT